MNKNDQSPPSTEEHSATPAEIHAQRDSEAAPNEDKQQSTKEPEPPTPAQTSAHTPRSRGGRMLAILAFLIAALALGGTYYLWLETAQLRQALDAERYQSRQSIENANAQTLTRVERLQNQQDQLQRNQGELNATFGQIRELLGRDAQAWRLAEVDYLLTVANHELQLRRDVNTALSALRLADKRLHELNNPGLTPVRQAIAQEITALNALERPDITGTALQLSSLQDELETLRLRQAATPDESPLADQGEPLTVAGMFEELKDVVRVRRHDQPIAPMLSPAQETAVRQVLALRLESAQAALLNRKQRQFVQAVNQARSWLRQHFDTGDSAVAGAEETLTQMAQRNIEPKLPDISSSIKALRDYLARYGNGGGA